MSVEQKVVVITGASQGIGAGLVKSFRERNYRIVANSRSIGASGDQNILTVAGDISLPETARRVAEEALSRFGRIDSLVNNAGIYIGKRFTDYTEADFRDMIAVNLAGFFHVTQACIPVMERRGAGHVVNITTSLVDHPISGSPSALASLTKGGLNAVTRSLAIEYARRGVRVNAVALGVIKTPMHAAETYEALAKFHPLGRMGEVQDVVNAVLFLERSDFVTGEILHVDGGRSAGH
jgi:NAD(P)-dependent dehydrogenase (short-subunit alcohol dehydrogenase family)